MEGAGILPGAVGGAPRSVSPGIGLGRESTCTQMNRNADFSCHDCYHTWGKIAGVLPQGLHGRKIKAKIGETIAR